MGHRAFSNKSAGLQRLEELAGAIQTSRLQPEQLSYHLTELRQYLAREIERFQHYRAMFTDAQVAEGFADVLSALDRLRELAGELGPRSRSWSESEWRGYLADAHDADRLLREAADFLRG